VIHVSPSPTHPQAYAHPYALLSAPASGMHTVDLGGGGSAGPVACASSVVIAGDAADGITGDKSVPLIPIVSGGALGPAVSTPNVSASASTPSAPPATLRCLCFDLTRLSPLLQLSLLSGGVFVFFILNSFLEEYTFKIIEGFKYELAPHLPE
jgi:hypothetical protein